MLLLAISSFAFGQGLTPDTSVSFGAVDTNGIGYNTIQFSGPANGVTIGTITAVTEGVSSEDFNLVPAANDCRDFTGTFYKIDSCDIEIAFTPTQIGTRLGALLITDSTGQIINTIYLSGTGIGPQFVFAPARAVTTSSATTLPNPSTFTAGAAVQDSSGDLFFTDGTNDRILERTSAGVFSPVASLPAKPAGIAMDGAGTLYVSAGSSIYTIPYGGTAATLFAITGATLGTPTGLAMDLSGDLYIADAATSQIYQVPLGSNGVASTLALGAPGAPLSGPMGLAVYAAYNANDSLISTNLYIADSGHNRIVEVALGPNSTSILPLTSLTLSDPTGVSVDAAGTVYIANTGGGNVIESTVAGTQFVLTDPRLTLSAPSGIVIDGAGNLEIADSSLGLVYLERSNPLLHFRTPTIVGDVDSTDGPLDLTVQGTGNIPSTLTAGPDPSISTAAFLLDPTSGTCPALSSGASPTSADLFAIGQICTYGVEFQPTAVGPNPANLVLTTSAASTALTSTSTARLFGIGLSNIHSFTLVASPSTINLNGSVELVLTALQTDGAIATDYTGTVTFADTDTNGKYLGGTGAGANTTTYTFTAADNGVLTIPAATGLQLNQYGVFTASVSGTGCPPSANCNATSNNIYVVEPSTLTLTSSVNPSLINQSTTFTLTVATTGTVPPGGTVLFYNNGVEIGSEPLSGGSASINDSFPTAGTYPITATYTSTTNTQGGTAALTQIVGGASTVTLTSSVNPSLVNQSTTLTASITALASPTGTVTFYSGSTAIGSAPVTGTTATISTSFATAGTFPLTAVYTSTDTSVEGSTSAILSQLVENLAQLTLTSSVNPSLVNQPTTLTATLAALGTPTGTVTFYDGSTVIGTAAINGLSASISVSFSTTGTHTLKAVYTSGNTSTGNATSAPLLQVVLNATTITLASSVNPSLVNQNTTLSAVVQSAGTPTGTVTFKSNGATLGTGTIAGGVATLAGSFPTAGSYSLTAVYSGDTNNQASTSAPLTQVVLNVATITLTSSANPVLLDNPTILTAALTSTGPAPTGTISFFDGSTPIGSGTLVNGTLSISASFVYAGAHTITASYSGDAVTVPATSLGFTQTVGDFALAVASGGSSAGSTIAGGTATYSLAMTPIFDTALPSAVSITVTGLPTGATGVITPSTIATGSGATPVALSVTAAQILAALHVPPARRRSPAQSPAHYAPVVLAFLTLPLAWFRRRKRFGSLLTSICLLLVLTAGLTGCISSAASGYYGQTPDTYHLTVTATSGNLVRSTYLTLTIQ